MRCLVTGGAGFIGSLLCGELLKAGHEVTALDNFRYRQTSLAEYCSNPNFTVIRGDCRNSSILNKLVAKADVIIPLAAIVGAPACDADAVAAETTNLDAVIKILATKSKDQWCLFPNSNSGYGIGSDAPCTEDSPLRPISIYGQTKCEAEQAVLAQQNALTFRFATLMGCSPRMRFDLLVNDFCRRAVVDGFVVLYESHFMRNYLHVRDAARVFLWAMDNFEKMRGKPYNVGLADANLSKWQLCHRIKEYVPDFYFSEAPIGEDVDKRNYTVQNDRILATGWKPQYSLDNAIREVVGAMPIYRSGQYANI